MKGIILAGGLGSRLLPVTKVLNKHVLPVYDKPMFFWPLQTLIDSGIKKIAVVSGPPHGNQIKELIQAFPKRQALQIKYVLQEKPLGMPDAILQCKEFAGGDSVIVSAGDNIYGGNFSKEVPNFEEGAVSFLRKVKDPERYAIPVYSGDLIVKIQEKPKNPETNWAVTGPHLFDKGVFRSINKLRPSKRGELEISDLNSLYIREGKLKLLKRTDFWLDVGTYDALLEASNFMSRSKAMDRT